MMTNVAVFLNGPFLKGVWDLEKKTTLEEGEGETISALAHWKFYCVPKERNSTACYAVEDNPKHASLIGLHLFHSL